MTTKTTINYPEFFQLLEDELSQATTDFIDTYISEHTECEGIDFLELRDAMTAVVISRLSITVKA